MFKYKNTCYTLPLHVPLDAAPPLNADPPRKQTPLWMQTTLWMQTPWMLSPWIQTPWMQTPLDADPPGCRSPQADLTGCRPPLADPPSDADPPIGRLLQADPAPHPLWTEGMTHACENIFAPFWQTFLLFRPYPDLGGNDGGRWCEKNQSYSGCPETRFGVGSFEIQGNFKNASLVLAKCQNSSSQNKVLFTSL